MDAGGLCDRVLDALLETRPEWATEVGDHRYDARLQDLGPDGVAATVALLDDALGALDEVDDAGWEVDTRIDVEILRTAVAAQRWSLTEVRAHEHDPLLHLPGDALYPLIVRDGPDPADRVRDVAARLAAVPARLDTARSLLRDMPRVHVETAINQARGTVVLLGDELDALAELAPGAAPSLDAARTAAAQALEGFARWLTDRLPTSDADPRIGAERYAAKLWYTLDTETTPDRLLTRAESDLQAVEEEIAELASRIEGEPGRAGQVRDLLDRLAGEAPVDDASILRLCRRALVEATERVRALDLVSVPDQPVEIVVMPLARRGVSVAYCDAPGPLEPVRSGDPVPSLFAVAPAPDGWPAERVASLYREYNGHMLRELTVHEAMPGHVLQLAHARQAFAENRISRARAAMQSEPFIEGWAVYAEYLLGGFGFGHDQAMDDALLMHQLKMQLRATINAILDVRVHAHGMTELEAMRLMTERGHQEDGEAAGKWRRAQLTSAQLSTYYVGYREIQDLVRDLREAWPEAGQRQIHDALLAHGSPSPRYLRALLNLGAEPGLP
jgi:uncharacterized protein (DUF885 family)